MSNNLRGSKRRDKIVQAAGRLFACQGYHGTSTRQIAHLADVGENTLFRHFADKETLFWSTLGAHSSVLEFHQDLRDGITNGEPLEIVLPKILELFTDTVNYRPELLGLIAIAFLELYPRAEGFLEERISPVLWTISNYFSMKIREGRLRNLDPTTLTAALMMTTLSHAGISKLIDKKMPLLNYQDRNRAYAKFWLDILAPRTPAYPSTESPPAEKDRS